MAKEGIIRRLISVQLHSRMERLFPMGTTDVSVFCPLGILPTQNTDGLLVLMRALHITGDKTKEADYESCESTDLSARFP